MIDYDEFINDVTLFKRLDEVFNRGFVLIVHCNNVQALFPT